MGQQQSRKTRKIAAIAAGVLVAGVGVTYTLASWTDSEWVWGGADGGPGVGTSAFEVQQDVSVPFANTGWADEEDAPGGELTFTAGAMALTPGDTVYAPVALRTASDSIAGDVTLQPAVAAGGIAVDDPEGDLWDAIELSVYTAQGDAQDDFASGADCTQAGVGEWGQPIVTGTLDDGATAAQRLDAEAGSVQHYCFALTLPDTVANQADADLQGLTIAPAWEFQSVSSDD